MRSLSDLLRASFGAVATTLALGLAAGGAASAAGPAPAPRGCDYCRMRIEDPAFEGEITGERGRRWRFDAIECMAAAVLTDSVPPRAIRAITARAVAPPHAPLDVRRARFLHGPGLPSPMGMHLSAHAGEAAALAAKRRHGGRLLDWRGVLATVDSLWFQGRLDVDRHAGLPARGTQARSVESSSRR